MKKAIYGTEHPVLRTADFEKLNKKLIQHQLNSRTHPTVIPPKQTQTQMIEMKKHKCMRKRLEEQEFVDEDFWHKMPRIQFRDEDSAFDCCTRSYFKQLRVDVDKEVTKTVDETAALALSLNQSDEEVFNNNSEIADGKTIWTENFWCTEMEMV